MLSVARVPVLGRELLGVASFLYDGDKVRRFTTYGGAYVDNIVANDDGMLKLNIKSPRNNLALSFKSGETFGLIAPDNTGMHREIRESVNGSLKIDLLSHSGRHLFSDCSGNASLELCGKIMQLQKSRSDK